MRVSGAREELTIGLLHSGEAGPKLKGTTPKHWLGCVFFLDPIVIFVYAAWGRLNKKGKSLPASLETAGDTLMKTLEGLLVTA